jgi:superoxide reductase
MPVDLVLPADKLLHADDPLLSAFSIPARRYKMDRRTFLKSAVAGTVVAGLTGKSLAADIFYPVEVDRTLFGVINRVKNPASKTALEKSHAPVFKAPSSVKAGEPFVVEVSVGENLHVMGQNHWIGYIELSIGNEPAGRADFQSKGYLRPRVQFNMVIPRETAPAGKVTLVAKQECNLHGIWEGTIDIAVI